MRRDFFRSLLKILHLTLNLLPCNSFLIQLLLQLGNVGLSRILRILAIWGGHLRNGIHFFFFVLNWLFHGIHSFQFFICWLCAYNFLLLILWLNGLFILSEWILILWITESRFSKNARMLAVWLSIYLGNSAPLRHL